MKPIVFKDLIIHEDEDFIVINKPPYISTLDDRNDPRNILALAKDYCESAQVCHRLDKETSGCLVIAKNQEAYRHIAMQFEDRSVKKIYHAVVEGIHDFKKTRVDRNLSTTNKGIAKINKDGKPALTYFDTIKSYKAHTLVECQPVTGRLHQIRAHISFMNAPICGDELYGGKPLFLSQIKRKFNLKKEEEERPLMQRVALHAYAIHFENLSGKKLDVVSPYPKDMAVLIKQLDLNS
ncbi:RluA family pseudouridine synthase [Penaeicola halotolerans]|uniref:RluA family pseudouridine synthase n=1 Tax=Penaeicola halotolerans TaxID=2793196 RepID=UPI001CF80E14|nr:RluA family pseudouridine synthase [Penaeicola halotolerans]